MLPRPCDGKIIEPEDAKSCDRNCPRAPIRPDDGHGSHSGARGTIQVVCDRRRLSSARRDLLFSKGESLEEGGIDGPGGRFQLLSRKELGRLRGGGSSYGRQFNACGEDSHAARPWPTSKVPARNRGIQRQTGCDPGRDFTGEAQALTAMEPKTSHNCPPIQRVVSIA